MKRPKNAAAAIEDILDSVEVLIASNSKANNRAGKLARAEREVAGYRNQPRAVSAPARNDDDRRHVAGRSDRLARNGRLTRAEIEPKSGVRSRTVPCPYWRA